MATYNKRQGIMLCQPLDDRNLEKNLKICPYMIAQPKLDGIRAWVKWNSCPCEGLPELISSQGNPIHGVPHIQYALKELRKYYGKAPQLDGELYAHKTPFETIAACCARETQLHEEYLSIKFHIFDYKDTTRSNAERLIILHNIMNAWRQQSSEEMRDVLQLVDHAVTNPDKIWFHTDLYLKLGYEGIILRNPLAPYQNARVFTMLKWKPSKHDWYRIVGVEGAKTQSTSTTIMLGALICEDRYGNQFKVGCGSGVTQEKKIELWEQRDTVLGQFCHVEYQNLTKNSIPRFGRFTTIGIDFMNGEVW